MEKTTISSNTAPETDRTTSKRPGERTRPTHHNKRKEGQGRQEPQRTSGTIHAVLDEGVGQTTPIGVDTGKNVETTN